MFGIYHESGRSLYIDSYYLLVKGYVISLKADKQAYQMRQIGKIIVRGAQDGILTITRPNHAWTSIPEGEKEIAARERPTALGFLGPMYPGSAGRIAIWSFCNR